MKSFFIAILLVFVFSCSDESKKTAAEIMAASISNSISASLDCTNLDAIYDDVKPVVFKWFNVNESAKKSIGSDVCKAAVSFIVPQIVGTAIPKTWNCKLETLDNLVNLVGESVCKNL